MNELIIRASGPRIDQAILWCIRNIGFSGWRGGWCQRKHTPGEALDALQRLIFSRAASCTILLEFDNPQDVDRFWAFWTELSAEREVA
jgi:hypothetical protein